MNHGLFRGENSSTLFLELAIARDTGPRRLVLGLKLRAASPSTCAGASTLGDTVRRGNTMRDTCSSHTLPRSRLQQRLLDAQGRKGLKALRRLHQHLPWQPLQPPQRCLTWQ